MFVLVGALVGGLTQIFWRQIVGVFAILLAVAAIQWVIAIPERTAVNNNISFDVIEPRINHDGMWVIGYRFNNGSSNLELRNLYFECEEGVSENAAEVIDAGQHSGALLMRTLHPDFNPGECKPRYDVEKVRRVPARYADVSLTTELRREDDYKANLIVTVVNNSDRPLKSASISCVTRWPNDDENREKDLVINDDGGIIAPGQTKVEIFEIDSGYGDYSGAVSECTF